MPSPSTMSTEWPERLTTLLERQQALVDQLAVLADQQASLIERGETDALLGLLTRRQQVIDQFTAMQIELGELTGDLERRLAAVDEAKRERIRTLLNKIGERLNAVMERDARDQQALETARDRSKEALASLDTGRHARQAYLGSGRARNRFADRLG